MLIKPVVDGLCSGRNETTKQRRVASDLQSLTPARRRHIFFINRMVTQRVLIRCNTVIDVFNTSIGQ